MVDLRDKGYNPDEDYGTYGTPDAIPAGDYKVMIVDSDERETRSGTGEYVRLVFEVIEGDYKGRKLFENLNLVNENPIAVRIAKAELKAICEACGGLTPQDTTELHNIPMIARVGQKKREDTGDMQNNIKRFMALGDTTVASTQAAGPDVSARKAPWKQKG